MKSSLIKITLKRFDSRDKKTYLKKLTNIKTIKENPIL